MIKYTTNFVDKLEDILQESKYTVRYERGNFQSGWCLLDHKRVVVLNKFLNTEGRVNTLVELIPQLKIDYDKLTLNSQKLFDFLTENRLEKLGIEKEAEPVQDDANEDISSPAQTNDPQMNTAETDAASDAEHEQKSDEQGAAQDTAASGDSATQEEGNDDDVS